MLKVFNKQQKDISKVPLIAVSTMNGNVLNFWINSQNKGLEADTRLSSIDTVTEEEFVETFKECYDCDEKDIKKIYKEVLRYKGIYEGDRIFLFDNEMEFMFDVLLTYQKEEMSCEAFELHVNSRRAEQTDFGRQEDIGERPKGVKCNFGVCCYNSTWIKGEITDEINQNYSITKDEFDFISSEIDKCIIKGSCNLCN